MSRGRGASKGVGRGAAPVDVARLLPAEGWLARIQEGNPFGPVEELLACVRDQLARPDIEGVLIHGAQGVRSLHVAFVPRG